LHIDSAYTLAEARARGKMTYLLARHASGLFDRVWSVHPVADVNGADSSAIEIHRIASNHAVIEGKARLFPLLRFLAPLNLILSQFALYRLLVRIVREQQLSVVVGVDPFLSGLLALAVARKTGRPLVIRVSGNADDIYEASGALAMPRLLPTHWLQKRIERFVLCRADLITAINRNNLQYAKTNGGRRLAILPISANIEPIHRVTPTERTGGGPLLERLGVERGRPALLYVGRLIELKHPEDALRAMAEVISRHPGTVGIMAGSGEMERRLKSLGTELGVADHIRFPGLLDQRELSLLIPHCVLLSPSAGQMAVLEAALGGAPIVAYDRDFQSEFIADGVNGFMVPFRHWRAMAERAEALLVDPELFSRMSIANRKSALDYMAPERTRDAEWAAFERVLGDR
jgi:glycosyltransferase involved in cell wall biosynthesis